MKRRLTIEIDAGETACATKLGPYCRHLTMSWFGPEPICALFDDGGETGETVLREVDGKAQRCEECLRAEVKP